MVADGLRGHADGLREGLRLRLPVVAVAGPRLSMTAVADERQREALRLPGVSATGDAVAAISAGPVSATGDAVAAISAGPVSATGDAVAAISAGPVSATGDAVAAISAGPVSATVVASTTTAGPVSATVVASTTTAGPVFATVVASTTTPVSILRGCCGRYLSGRLGGCHGSGDSCGGEEPSGEAGCADEPGHFPADAGSHDDVLVRVGGCA
ncbi:hypothetical protein [Streptomyces sp. NBC_00724]|uniref:hypothetical protein n=1 Tax=Streptomyces sp. NBC_00724 TaxID=2975812 RepID=UPI002ECFEC23|nr:hypothetical protein OHB17_42065 [Streptomyces sp. NBC_00724]